MHGTTKRIPAEVFKEERETLRPLDRDIMLPETKILRMVRKDNTIIYTSNRYTVPFGTYNKHKEVIIKRYLEKGEPNGKKTYRQHSDHC